MFLLPPVLYSLFFFIALPPLSLSLSFSFFLSPSLYLAKTLSDQFYLLVSDGFASGKGHRAQTAGLVSYTPSFSLSLHPCCSKGRNEEMTVVGTVAKTQLLDPRKGVCPGSGQNVTVAMKAVVKKRSCLDRSQKPDCWTPGKGSVQDLAKT